MIVIKLEVYFMMDEFDEKNVTENVLNLTSVNKFNDARLK